jgi:hypothetical protein
VSCNWLQLADRSRGTYRSTDVPVFGCIDGSQRRFGGRSRERDSGRFSPQDYAFEGRNAQIADIRRLRNDTASDAFVAAVKTAFLSVMSRSAQRKAAP